MRVLRAVVGALFVRTREANFAKRRPVGSQLVGGGVGLFDKTFHAFGKPVIPASLLAVAIHSLLDYDPVAITGHDESVQIEIKAILYGGAVYLGDEPARLCERRPVKAHPLPD